MAKQQKMLKGVLEFFSETGTEGGYWAFQDGQFIKRVSPDFGVWANTIVWDETNQDRKGKTLEDVEVMHKGKWLPLPDPMQKDPDYYISSLWAGELGGDREADKRLMKKYGFKIEYFEDYMNKRFGRGNWHFEDATVAVTADGTRYLAGGTPRTKPNRPYGVSHGEITRCTVMWEDGTSEQRLSTSLLVEGWSYEGLHVLEDGDELTIYDKNDPLKIIWSGTIKLKHHGVFAEDAYGYWIHADQEGINRETWALWFFNQNPAQLVVKEKNKQNTA